MTIRDDAGLSRDAGGHAGAPESVRLSVSAQPPESVRLPDPAQPPSLIETMRMERGGALPLLDGHLRRLRSSCDALRYAWPGEAAIRDGIAQEASGLHAGGMWRLRLLLAPDGGLSFETGPLPAPQPPLRVVLAGPRATGAEDWLLHKTTHRPWYEDAATWLAAHPDVFDVLYWTPDGEMCEGSRSNLYMLTADGRWLTPPLSAGVLPGVQRSALLEAGQAEEGAISLEEFRLARRWRVSNALRGWQEAVLVG